MKIIFLDIDGVLNTDVTWERRHIEFISSGKIICPIDEFRIKCLKKIIDETEARIVLFSTWSGGFKKENDKILPLELIKDSYAKGLYDLFNKYEIKIYDKISKNETKVKKSEKLKLWLLNNDVEEFIIIEDEPNSLIEDFGDNIIDVSKNGLNKEHVDSAIRKLNNSKHKVKTYFDNSY